jgi:hypothetical protein
MSLRQSGFWCDVCNSPMVTEMLFNQNIGSFKVACSPTELHYHDKCWEIGKKALMLADDSLLKEDSPLGILIRRVNEHNAGVAKAEKATAQQAGVQDASD